MNQPLSLYLHFPYCWSKCHYCAFNSIRYDKPQSLRFLSALKREILRYGRSALVHERRLSSIYMGGGTPSIFTADQVLDVLNQCRASFAWADDIEITMEANPGTIALEKLTALKNGGINRLSMGVQSLQDDELVWLGRAHTSGTARKAYRMAREAGFTNINLDFIYALPNQRLEDWERTLDEAIGLGPEHLSAYALTLEEGTRFGEDHESGLLILPDEERQIRFDELTWTKLGEAGYLRYEVSNYSRPGFACRHNLGYWNQKDYLGLGPGAHSYLSSGGRADRWGQISNLSPPDAPMPPNPAPLAAEPRTGFFFSGRRFSKIEDIETYIRMVEAGEDAIEESEPIRPDLAFCEAVIFGLRKTEGIHLDEILPRSSPADPTRFHRKLEQLNLDELIVLDLPRVRLSRKGFQVWDRIAEEIIAVF